VDRTAAGASIAWLISCAPVALPAVWHPAEAALGESSRLALAALPWLAWIGAPGSSRTSPLGTAALCVPPLAAAFAVDAGHGRALVPLAIVSGAAIAMVVLLGLAARGAAARGSDRIYAIAWLLLVPGLPVLRASLEAGGAPSWGAAPRWLTFLSGASPIGWAWSGCASTTPEGPGAGTWAALAVCASLLALAVLPGRAAP